MSTSKSSPRCMYCSSYAVKVESSFEKPGGVSKLVAELNGAGKTAELRSML